MKITVILYSHFRRQKRGSTPWISLSEAKCFLLKIKNEPRISALAPNMRHFTWSLIHSNKARKTNKWLTDWERGNETALIHRWYGYPHRKIPWNLPLKLLELLSAFSNVATCNSIATYRAHFYPCTSSEQLQNKQTGKKWLCTQPFYNTFPRKPVKTYAVAVCWKLQKAGERNKRPKETETHTVFMGW